MKTSIIVALVGVAIALSCASRASAAAPMAKTQAPGFYRMMLGDFEITALNDGVVDYDTGQVLPGSTPEHIAKRLCAMGLSDPVGMSYNAFLINTGEKLQMAAERDYWIAGGHLSFPGIGHVRATEGQYSWIPINYSIPHSAIVGSP